MSSVLARYDVSGERRKPNPSGSTSSVPSPKIDSPFFAWFLSMAKMRSCLRRRFAPSIWLATAMSTSSVTWRDFNSERCIDDRIKDEREPGWTRGLPELLLDYGEEGARGVAGAGFWLRRSL